MGKSKGEYMFIPIYTKCIISNKGFNSIIDDLIKMTTDDHRWNIHINKLFLGSIRKSNDCYYFDYFLYEDRFQIGWVHPGPVPKIVGKIYTNENNETEAEIKICIYIYHILFILIMIFGPLILIRNIQYLYEETAFGLSIFIFIVALGFCAWAISKYYRTLKTLLNNFKIVFGEK